MWNCRFIIPPRGSGLSDCIDCLGLGNNSGEPQLNLKPVDAQKDIRINARIYTPPPCFDQDGCNNQRINT